MTKEAELGAPALGDEKPLPEAEDEQEDAETEEPESEDEGDEEDEGGEPETKAAGEEDKPSKSKLKRERIRARIADAEREATEAKTRADTAERMLRSLTEELGPEPKETDYDDERKYTAALAAYEADKRALARQKKAQETAVTEARTDVKVTALKTFHERMNALTERFPDIREKVLSREHLPIPDAHAEALMDSERGPEVAYYLATNPAEARRIFALPPLSAAREYGRIEAKIAAPSPRTVTKAPPPVPTLSGSGHRAAAKSPDRMTPKEYEKWRVNGGGA